MHYVHAMHVILPHLVYHIDQVHVEYFEDLIIINNNMIIKKFKITNNNVPDILTTFIFRIDII